MNTDTQTSSFHSEVLAYEKANNWPYFYALGYASGIDDARNHRKSEHKLTETDDYALGYHKGWWDNTAKPALATWESNQ